MVMEVEVSCLCSSGQSCYKADLGISSFTRNPVPQTAASQWLTERMRKGLGTLFHHQTALMSTPSSWPRLPWDCTTPSPLNFSLLTSLRHPALMCPYQSHWCRESSLTAVLWTAFQLKTHLGTITHNSHYKLLLAPSTGIGIHFTNELWELNKVPCPSLV